jgi:dextranase
LELLPLKASFAPGGTIAIEIRAPAEGVARVFHLDAVVAEVEVAADHTLLEFEPLPTGGYGLEVEHAGGTAVTAFDVLVDPLSRPRYGFVSRYERDRDIGAVIENVRGLHLNAVQFYDWMYRHADLLPPAEEYEDPLGRALSLETVRALAHELRRAGSVPLAYAAVYAVGREEWSQWETSGLYRADGTPWTLGEDFLWIVDPTDERWLGHLARDLHRAFDACGFDGFHLDQYGAPKRAQRADGSLVDMAAAFPQLITNLRAALPTARLIFNNVNNYPTWATAGAPHDAVYIEVWPPHTQLDHLARLVRDARAVSDKPVILAAYMSVFASAAEDAALDAARLAMATIFSHGGFHLLAGEDGAVLTDPYYVRHHAAGDATVTALRRWYDFAVRYGDLLYDPAATDVTTAFAGGVNEDVIVQGDVAVSVDPEPGAVWLRVVETAAGLVFHLIDLAASGDVGWDLPKRSRGTVNETTVRVRRAGEASPLLHVASPESSPALTPVKAEPDAAYDLYELPEWRDWVLCLHRPST